MSGVIEIIAFCTSATSIFLASRQKAVTFVLGVANNTMFAILFYQQHLYSIMALQCSYILLNLYGMAKWWGWFGLNGKEKKLRISSLKVEEMGALLAMVLAAGVLLATFVVRMSGIVPEMFPSPKYPLLDACLTTASIVAQILMIKKKIQVWCVWIILNIIKTALYFEVGLALTAVLHIIYIGIAVDAIRHWNKEYNTYKR